MGWVECRVGGRLTVPEVEAWLIADALYAIYLWVSRGRLTSSSRQHSSCPCTTCKIWINNNVGGVWNLFSVFSVLFPVLWAPFRIYWLLRLRTWTDVKPSSKTA